MSFTQNQILYHRTIDLLLECLLRKNAIQLGLNLLNPRQRPN